MILEARAASCFSWTYVLKANDRAVGKYETRWFSENLTVDLTGRRHLEYRKTSWLGSQFELVDLAEDAVVAWCDRSGIFTSSWDLDLEVGRGELVSTGWLETAFEFVLDGEALARVDRLGWCERGWSVDAASILKPEDVVMIGLVYHTIMNRRQQQQSAAGGAAAGT